MASVISIEFTWAEHPDWKYSNAGRVEAPLISARLSVHEPHIFFRADLNPAAAFTVFPLSAAQEIDGLIVADLSLVVDPVLRLSLAVWTGRQKVEILGDNLKDHIALRLPVAFDATGKIGTAILGQDFFQLTRIILDRRAGSSATLL